MFFIMSCFFISPLHVRRRLPYILKGDSSEGISNSSTNEVLLLYQFNGKIRLISHLSCPFTTYYLDPYLLPVLQ